MKKNSTELVFILDRSGSMAGLESDTIGGYNSMLAKQRKEDGECRITTVLFNEQYKLLHDRIDIQAVGDITEKDYQVGGCTALLDAIGKSIDKIVSVQRNTAEDYRAEKVIFVIITDGKENASSRYSLAQIKALIEKEQEGYGWEFLFLGANIDAVEVAGGMGIRASRAVDYVPDGDGTRLNYVTVADVISSYRSRGTVDEDCLDAIREDMRKRGGKRP